MPFQSYSSGVTETGSLSITASSAAFTQMVCAYEETWSLHCLLTDTSGQLLDNYAQSPKERCDLRRRAIAEALRWGEPSILAAPANELLWAVPVMHNATVIGGIVVEGVRLGEDAFPDGGLSAVDVRHAAADLLHMAKEANLTNAALLEFRKRETARESQRAEAIHELKHLDYRSIRDVYLAEEPALLAAIKHGDTHAAREIINRVLAAIYHLGMERPEVLKSYLLELVVTMSRSAVEAGADSTELLGTNYSSFAELSHINSEEELCAWLVSMLERIMDAIKANIQYPSNVLVAQAIKYMQDNLRNPISRDEVADVACLSPSHFSRVVKQTFGYSFTELLARMRVECAQDSLARTEKSLVQVGLDCGFNDQSYFTKVFQRYTGQTPGEFRRLHSGTSFATS